MKHGRPEVHSLLSQSGLWWGSVYFCHIEQKVLQKKDQKILWCQIDFLIICYLFRSNHFLIRFCFSRLFNIHLATRLGYLGSQWRGVSKKTRWLKRNLLKFIYSEKGKKFCEIFTLLLTTEHTVKGKLKIYEL